MGRLEKVRESQKVVGIRSIKSRCTTLMGKGVMGDRKETLYPLKSSGKVNAPNLFGAERLSVDWRGIVPVTKCTVALLECKGTWR